MSEKSQHPYKTLRVIFVHVVGENLIAGISVSVSEAHESCHGPIGLMNV